MIKPAMFAPALAGKRAFPDNLHLAGAGKFAHQHERLAPTDENRIRRPQQRLRPSVIVTMQRFRRRHADVREGRAQSRFHAIAIGGVRGMQYERDLATTRVMFAHRGEHAVGETIAIHHAAAADQNGGLR
jgi:hypothetical protein